MPDEWAVDRGILPKPTNVVEVTIGIEWNVRPRFKGSKLGVVCLLRIAEMDVLSARLAPAQTAAHTEDEIGFQNAESDIAQ